MQRVVGTYSIEGQVIEYSIVGKTGIPILVMHGGHSNCHEVFGYEALVARGFKIITPSRAGYGKTSKEMGESLAEACHFYVELLNYLEIKTVHILSMSAGGPSGLYLASCYPDRVKTLTLQSAVTKEWHTSGDKMYTIAQILFNTYNEKMTWKFIATMSRFFPEFTFKQMSSSFSKLAYHQIIDKMQSEDVDEVRKMNNRQRSRAGFLIDLLQTKEVTTNDLKKIAVPTLIMHSKYDAAVPMEHAQYAKHFISNTELCVLESWGHLIWLGKGSEVIHDTLLSFLKRHETVVE